MASGGMRKRFSRTSNSGSLAKYGALHEPPKDDAVCYPKDDTHSFFASGRDFESAYVNHTYTEEEKETLATYESLDYLPSHSEVYKNWLKRQPTRLDWDRWVMMGLIGFSVGFVGFLLHQTIDVISDFKWDKAREYLAEEDILVAWGWVLGYGLIFVIIGAALVVFWRPSAGGSGMPELIGFLNGTIVRHIFNVQTMLVKFLSCCCAVGSGLPVGPEGPMIHLGSLFGAGVSQFKSDTLKFKLPFFERFRNSEDRRNFISAGAAAGVASAFGAPVGGLLFSMEEVSSFWNMKLSWQIFFCAMVSTFTTDLFNSALSAFRYEGSFGLFRTERYILFQVKNGLAVNILAFIPSIILGVIGGLLGAMFTFVNLKIARTRKRLLARLNRSWKQRIFRMSEPIVIMVIVATVSVFLPSLFPCSKYICMHKNGGNLSEDCVNDSRSLLHTETGVQRYTCPDGVIYADGNATLTNSTYNQMATLFFVTGEKAIHHLFSRNTHLQFDYGPLVTALVYYFVLACWCAGTSVSSGLVVPMLYIGGVYGRIIGLAMVSIFGIHTTPGSYWAWMDPGAFALVGAASFFGGVSRLTMSLTVIMMEITNDIQFLLLIMVAIMVAKWVGDFFTHPLYHALLELKCIPFLDSEPVIVHEGKENVNLELFCARDIMTPRPCILHSTDSVSRIADILMNTPHGGYPVVTTAANGEYVFYGFINRLEIIILMKSEDMFISNPQEDYDGPHEVTAVDYHQLNVDKLTNPHQIEELLLRYAEEPRYNNLYLNMSPYVNQSAVSVQDKFSLHRTYIIFRTLGLRHLTVVDSQNRVVGVITRKDLMGFNMEDKLKKRLHGNQATVAEEEIQELSQPI